MKKVMFLVPSLGMGGMERVLVNYANLFVRRGYDVTVYNMTSDDSAIVQHFDPAVNYYSSYVPVKHICHAKISDILSGRFRILPLGKWINFHSAKYLHKKYIKEHFDIEIAFFGMNGLKIVSGSTGENTQKIGWIHGEQKENDFAPIEKYEDAIRIFQNIDKFICVSERAMKTVGQIYQRHHNLYVVNNPNDTNKIRELSKQSGAPEKRRFTFVNASRFDDKQKGYSRLLKVCKQLLDEGYEFDFWLVGDGVDFDKIKALIAEYKMDNIFLLGKQDNPYKFIKNGDMYVCFSYSEGFSMVMMEAVILATPMLSTDVPGASEMLDNGQYGMIVENSEKGLYEGMKKILSDSELYAHYQIMAEKRKDYLSEENIMDCVEQIIN